GTSCATRGAPSPAPVAMVPQGRRPATSLAPDSGAALVGALAAARVTAATVERVRAVVLRVTAARERAGVLPGLAERERRAVPRGLRAAPAPPLEAQAGLVAAPAP